MAGILIPGFRQVYPACSGLKVNALRIGGQMLNLQYLFARHFTAMIAAVFERQIVIPILKRSPARFRAKGFYLVVLHQFNVKHAAEGACRCGVPACLLFRCQRAGFLTAFRALKGQQMAVACLQLRDVFAVALA
ncbi:hypothetical protein ACA373_21650 [Erwinia sp. STN24]|uniref:hypothetical protein n=1 Tax=Erwinia sp. STN24 TaxID=3233996 RepID=UPI003520A9AC